jgi:hypothetical protein
MRCLIAAGWTSSIPSAPEATLTRRFQAFSKSQLHQPCWSGPRPAGVPGSYPAIDLVSATPSCLAWELADR